MGMLGEKTYLWMQTDTVGFMEPSVNRVATDGLFGS